MTQDRLETFIDELRAVWGPLTTETVARSSALLEALVRAPEPPWLAALRCQPPDDRELHRDEHGFLLLAHGEREGRYRVPHDHGRGWVLYAV